MSRKEKFKMEQVSNTNYDFCGWATKANIKCSDGRVIMKDAFKHNDGQIVPLIFNHDHNNPDSVLGHALLENRSEGVYAYGKFNETDNGRTSKLLVEHGDITSLSIYANQLQENMGYVSHGNIRELSLVLAGANIGAHIENVIKHGEESETEAIIYNNEDEPLELFHAEEAQETKKEEPKKEEDPKMAEEKNEKTIKDMFDEFTDEQKDVVYAIVGMAMEENEDNDEGGDGEMKHNVFDNDATTSQGACLTHADQEAILKDAKKNGSFQGALHAFAEDNSLQHDALSSGFVQEGDGNIYNLFPEYKEVRPGAPELITNDQGWVSTVMAKVHKSPISRIRTTQADIRNIDRLRAKGYKKGKEKGIVGNFNLVRRTTDPQTVFVKNALHRDDIIDITDFDYVDYLYKIDKMMLNEELATAIMIGDGREDGDEFKIAEDKIRPIWTDDDLYTIHVDIDLEKAKSELQGTGTGVSFGENYIMAEAMTNTILYAKENYKGTGTPDLYITPHKLNVMLLARDMNGRRIYSSVSELASTLGVGNIYTAEQFNNKTRKTKDGEDKKLVALLVNLADYSLGATKGGEVTHFTQFDIDFNQEKSLLETRCSGALTRVYSAIAVEEPVANVEG